MVVLVLHPGQLEDRGGQALRVRCADQGPDIGAVGGELQRHNGEPLQCGAMAGLGRLPRLAVLALCVPIRRQRGQCQWSLPGPRWLVQRQVRWRPVFRGPQEEPPVRSRRVRRASSPVVIPGGGLPNPVTDALAPMNTPGLYVRGLGRTVTVDQAQRLFQRLTSSSPTLRSLPQMFSLRLWRTGAATVNHPAFHDREVVEQALADLGVSVEPAGLATADFGHIHIRGAREALALEDD